MSADRETQPVVPVEAEETSFWSNPADHFRPRAKLLTLYSDRNYVLARYLKWKEWFLNRWYVPTWTPVYFIATHLEQRNRNIALAQNHLNYKPYKYRNNTESSNY